MPVKDDESNGSNFSDTWIRRALAQTSVPLAEDKKEDEIFDQEDSLNNSSSSVAHPSRRSLKDDSPSKRFLPFFRKPQAEIVQTVMIQDRDHEIEVEQAWAEAESDDDDDDTAATHPSGSETATDSFAQRVGQPLVVLLSEDPMNCRFVFTNLQMVVVKADGSGDKKVVQKVSGPLDLLDVERGASTLVCQPLPSQTRSLAAPVSVSEAQTIGVEEPLSTNNNKRGNRKKSGTMPRQQISTEVGWAGRAWRATLIRLLLVTLDDVNRLRLSRALQTSLPFLTGYESFLLAAVIEGLDRSGSDNMKEIWKRAFSNRNVSRLIVQALRPRYDFIFHWGTAVTWNRPFDMLGQFPIIGAITRFPATENFPSTRNHALASIFRVVLGEGNWLTRVLTGGREGLITDDPNNTAQNLTAESNGFELANRNQYGTHFGRHLTNEFRFEHRLPTDESLVRTFVARPIPTTTNNGVVHTLRQLAKHWHNMLYQEFGNFAHQRMEQLAPFDTLRFHMPEMLVTLSSLRGRNIWDARVLGPVIQKLQKLRPESTAERARRLVRKLQQKVVVPVCGGVASVVEPFQSWLNAISISLDRIEEEAKEVYKLVSSVELGIRVGYDIMSQVSWKVPSDAVLQRAILRYIRRESLNKSGISERQIASALDQTTPRDKRTLIELIQKKQEDTVPAKLLLARVKTLLQREIRREILNGAIRDLSKGDYVGRMVENSWYWLESKTACELYSYLGRNGQKHQYIHVDSGSVKFVTRDSDLDVRARAYIPVAEAISRAQKVFMTIELNHGKTFAYNAFMEFVPLRIALRRLIVVSQMTCEALDNARLNVLSEIQRTAEVRDNPQNLVVIGGGPCGMLSTIHCTENCLVGGGVVKLFEARDSFAKGGSTYERAQVVRLDARWIAMMRYHCGTGFEDVYIPASGETDSQLGNTLPAQGFVEITIKDLENMLHVEISRYWSRGLITVFTDSRSRFDHVSNSLTKSGENLKVGDVIHRQLNSDGEPCTSGCLWKVVELVYTRLLGLDDLKVGEEYGVYYKPQRVVLPFKLTQVDLDQKIYHFEPQVAGIADVHVGVQDLPSVYPAGTQMSAHADVHQVVFESLDKNREGEFKRESMLMDTIKKQKFTLNVGKTHVIEAIGKPSDSRVHLRMTTQEPYAVCCLEGLKVSMGMHNFGEKRWGSGILDDIRSLNDQNTRIVGDFTKMVRTAPIVDLMYKILSDDKNWSLYFHKVVDASAFPELNNIDPVAAKIVSACGWLAKNSGKFRRRTLQTRFFETGDNFYLGMELPREFDQWKRDLSNQLVAELSTKDLLRGKESECEELKQALVHGLDQLWYFSCMEVIRTGDVYNPGARHRVPRLHVTDSLIPTSVGRLDVGESFRILDTPAEKYEVLAKKLSTVVVRNVEGYVFLLNKSAKVKRESNLTRCPDGNQESKVALASFPVSHYVNHRTMRLAANGYVFAFAGDEQATPHFMRYSGLTGAGVNAMSFNEFLKRANDGIPLRQRFREYSKETNWSNGEVVTRGTIGNYGDGFLRPGFSYDDCIDYLHAKVVECQESGQDVNEILSRDWLNKMAAALIPRGMELNEDFIGALRERWQEAVFSKMLREIQNDKELHEMALEDTLHTRKSQLHPYKCCSAGYWQAFLQGLPVNRATKKKLEQKCLATADPMDLICNQVIDFAAKAYLYNERLPSELLNQPKPVDSIVDDFAVEAQNFANSLTLSAAFGAGTLAFRLVNQQAADIGSAIFGGLNILIAFSTMTNVARYRIRNEEARVVFMDDKFADLKKEVFVLMDEKARRNVRREYDPLVSSLMVAALDVRNKTHYYDYGKPDEFDKELECLLEDGYNISKLNAFQEFLARRLIADTYHINSYVQESLVGVYRVVDEMISRLTEPEGRNGTRLTRSTAKHLFYWLLAFERRLEGSLQRGPVRWGFVKTRRFVHWDISIAVRYFYSLLWFLPWAGSCCAPIEKQTSSLLRRVQNLSKETRNRRLHREIQDVETLYWATRESDIASLIFVAAFLTFAASIVFTVARIFGIRHLTDLAFFAAGASALGAILAAFHFIRKFIILMKLWIALWIKTFKITPHYKNDLKLVRRVTFTQILLTVARFCAASAAAVALPFSVAENGYSDRIATADNLPFLIASGSIITAIGSTVFFFVVEYVVRYKLSTELGPFVCYIFKDEISKIHNELSIVQRNTVDTEQSRDREAWEYTARKFLHEYRFDTVFAADRFGQILQFLQTGMKNVTVPAPSEEALIAPYQLVTI